MEDKLLYCFKLPMGMVGGDIQEFVGYANDSDVTECVNIKGKPGKVK